VARGGKTPFRGLAQGKLGGRAHFAAAKLDEPDITGRSSLAQAGRGFLCLKVVTGTAVQEELAMKKMTLSLAAVALAASATAALAQPGYGHNRDFARPGFAAPAVNVDAKQAMIAQRIDNGLRNGSLNRREARRLNAELREIEALKHQFKRSRPGLTRVEIAQLDARLDRLSMQIRFERNDRQYGAGYGRW
jgi:hypothetical protein